MAASSVDVVPIVVSPKRAMEAPDVVEDEAAVEHPSKRIKREMLDYDAVDLDQLRVEDNGVDKNGNRRLRPLLGDGLLHCNVTPLGFHVSHFGFDVSGRFQKPSFLTNQPPRRSEGLYLPLRFRISKEYRFLQKVDSFFKNKVAEIDDTLKWRSLDLLHCHDARYEEYHTKVKVVLSGEGLTQLKIIDRKMNIHTGAGWDFLQPFMQEFDNFKLARVKVAVCLSDLWCMDGKAGLTLTATHLVLTFPKPRPDSKDHDDPFKDVFDPNAVLSEIAAE